VGELQLFGHPVLQGIFENVAALLDSNDETLMVPVHGW